MSESDEIRLMESRMSSEASLTTLIMSLSASRLGKLELTEDELVVSYAGLPQLPVLSSESEHQ